MVPLCRLCSRFSCAVLTALLVSHARLVAAPIPEVVAWDYNGAETTIPIGLSNVVAIAAGSFHSLALRADGTVVGWGGDSHGQTDIPSALSNVVAIAAGDEHSLALRADGTVVGWGQYGTPGVPTVIPIGLSNVVAIAAGGAFLGGHVSLALLADGGVVGWWNDGAATRIPSGLSNVVAIAAGAFNSLALRANGSVIGWNLLTGVETTFPSEFNNVVAIAVDYDHSLALRADGRVVGPVPTGLSNVVEITTRVYGPSLALRADGSVVGWDYYGALATIPAGLSKVVAIAGGAGNSLALRGSPPGLAAPEIIGSPPLSSPLHGEATFRVSLPTRSGHVYRLEYVDSLNDSHWTPLPLLPGTGALQTVIDPSAIAAQRFYRVRQW